MSQRSNTRRDFLKMMGISALTLTNLKPKAAPAQQPGAAIDPSFFVRPDELTLAFRQKRPERRLSFANFKGSPAA